MPARKSPPPRPYHHGNLRESLVEAAEELLEQHGVQGVTLREVARVAGVSHAAPYHHFAGLDALLAAVAERSFTQLGASIAKAAQAGEPRDALLRICEAYVAHACAHPAQFRLMFGPMLARKSEFPEFAGAARAAFTQVLEVAEALAPGEGAALALSGWSLAHGFAHLAIDRAMEDLPVPVSPDPATARRLAEWLLRRDAPAPGGKRQRRQRQAP